MGTCVRICVLLCAKSVYASACRYVCKLTRTQAFSRDHTRVQECRKGPPKHLGLSGGSHQYLALVYGGEAKQQRRNHAQRRGLVQGLRGRGRKGAVLTRLHLQAIEWMHRGARRCSNFCRTACKNARAVQQTKAYCCQDLWFLLQVLGLVLAPCVGIAQAAARLIIMHPPPECSPRRAAAPAAPQHLLCCDFTQFVWSTSDSAVAAHMHGAAAVDTCSAATEHWQHTFQVCGLNLRLGESSAPRERDPCILKRPGRQELMRPKHI